MNTETSEQRVVGAFGSCLVLFRSVWWLWPVGILFSLPGFRRLGQVGYSWLARRRYRLGKRTGTPARPYRRKIPFLDLP